MRTRSKILTLLISLVLALALVFSAASCGGTHDEETDYYLSVNGATYSSKDSAGSYLFTQSSSGTSYSLTVHLDEGDSIIVNELGGITSYGYTDLIGSDNFTSGSSNAAVVSYAGTYAFSLNTKFGLAYSFSADQSGIKLISTISELTEGSSFTFSALLAYSDGTTGTGTISWSTSDESVLYIDSNGKATAMSAGTATITASSNGFSASVDVTVNAAANVSVTGITLDQTSLEIELNSTATLTATVLPTNATNKGVSWSSDNEAVATVSEGVVTAVGYGTTTITATTAQGGKTANCTVTVPKHVESITLDPTTLTVNVDSTRDITLTFAPSDATNTGYEVSLDDSVASYTTTGSTITVTGVTAGTTTLTVTSKDDSSVTATCEITVQAAGTANYYISSTSIQTMIEEDATVSVTAENDTISNISWSTAQSGIATVAADDTNSTNTCAVAKVTGVYFGVTDITATVTFTSGGQKTFTCSVLVADDFFFLYGLNSDWTVYSSTDEAESAGTLLNSTSTPGIYTITRHFDANSTFHIAYPKVANYTEEDANGNSYWAIQIYAWQYYDSQASDSECMGDCSGDNFTIATAGTYTITLDLTSKGSCTSTSGYGRVYINMVAEDLSDITVTGATSLQIASGESSATTNLTFSYSPSNVAVSEDDFSVEASYSDSTYADGYVEIDSDFANKTISVSLIQDPAEAFKITLTVTLSNVSTTYEITVVPSGTEITETTAVTFTQNVYYIDVNNGGNAWATTVSASGNGTVTSVTYSTEDSSYISVASDGTVTANGFGTFTVKATSTENISVSAEATVVVYSSVFYIDGSMTADSDGNWTESIAQQATSIPDGSVFADYVLTASDDCQTFTYTGYIEAGNKFQIIFLGMSSDWDHQITSNYLESSGTGVSTDSPNVSITASGYYTITLDLSGKTPSLKVEQAVVATGISFTSSMSKLTPGGTFTYVATVTLSNGSTSTENIEYSTSDNTVISINESTGEAEAVGSTGSATLTATYGSLSVEITVTISSESVSASASLSGTTEIVYPSDTSTTLTVAVSDTESSISSVSWTSGSTSVATVSGDTSSATVTAASTPLFGSTLITATITLEDSTQLTATATVYVTGSYFYLSGVNEASWSHYDTVDAASTAGVLLEATDEDSLVYSVTVHIDTTTTTYGFGIYFGGIQNSTTVDGTETWPYYDYKITPGSYYDSTNSDTSYVNNGDNFVVTESGYYIVYLDFSQTGVARVYIKESSIDVTKVELSNGSSSLDSTTNTSLTFDISYEPEDVEVSSFTAAITSDNSNWATYVSINLDTTNKTVTVQCNSDPTETFTVTLTVEVNGVEATKTITIVSSTGTTVTTNSVKFAEESYSYNVNNGGSTPWTVTVYAAGYGDDGETLSTISTVTYSTSDSNVTVNESTGLVTASGLGTFTITATSDDVDTVSNTVKVTFYSDTFYICGGTNGTWNDNGGQGTGWYDWPSALSASTETIDASSVFYNYQFTEDTSSNHTIFTYTATSTEENTFLAWENFVIYYLGTSDWDSALGQDYVNQNSVPTGSTAAGYYGSTSGIQFGKDGTNADTAITITITIDLSGSTPVIYATV